MAGMSFSWRRTLAATTVMMAASSGAMSGPSPSSAQSPVAHATATCSDYPNQAAAQQAADTRDANHDGIFCNDLPCPCSTAAGGSGGGGGGGSTAPKPASTAPARVKLGPSILVAAWSKRSGCHIDGPLPDHRCSPGARFKYATKAKVCRSGYSKQVRNVTQASKNAVYAAYGMTTHFNGQSGEVDHLVSLELGGSNSRANLFPEAASPSPGSHEKDRLENRLHTEVCSGQITLRQAQKLIAGDWLTAYHARFG
ncbi:MAG: hypothetical protein JWM93_1581 [Frankiales bacterium]|nr:hypothetical protein [Frankiales bacterium]